MIIFHVSFLKANSAFFAFAHHIVICHCWLPLVTGGARVAFSTQVRPSVPNPYPEPAQRHRTASKGPTCPALLPKEQKKVATVLSGFFVHLYHGPALRCQARIRIRCGD